MSHGLALIDKPSGMTSHDVVGRVRRLLRTRQVGHAGTLDPMATGLLLVLVGEATKLSPFLTAERKRYRTDVTLGRGTDSLDADGRVTDEQPIPERVRHELSRGAASSELQRIVGDERARREQVPPVVSAIHVDGERAHERARRGESVEMAARAVQVFSLELLAVEAGAPCPQLTFELEVSKGYYVRSFGRDVGLSLGLPAHLTALRRLASGAFSVDEAHPLAEGLPLVPLSEAARRVLPAVTLTERGAARTSFGQRLEVDDFVEAPPPRGEPSGWFVDGELVAVGQDEGEGFRVLRGFRVG